MEPPPFGDGNVTGIGQIETAGTILQWSHRLSAMETSRTDDSPVRRTSLQWSHRLSAMETSRVSTCTTGRGVPSMEPPPFGDGNLRSTPSPAHSTASFNGATAFRRWKRTMMMKSIGGTLNLQWGHRLSAMETHHDDEVHRRHSQPSMGPPPFGDGNRSGPPRRRRPAGPFNGATAFRRWKPLIEAQAGDAG